jgi:Arc/MetJ family transcription regulator
MHKDGYRKNMSERMNIVIDATLAKTLRETALKKYGKLKGSSLLIEEALRRYFRAEGIEFASNYEEQGN